MFSTIRKIKNIKERFDGIPTENKFSQMFTLNKIERAPGSGISGDASAHQQGVYKLDGNENYIITGNVKNVDKHSLDHPYFYVARNGVGAKCFEGKDYYSIIVDPNDSTKFTHPGGIQVAENVLAIVLEGDGCTLVKFYDISGIPDKAGNEAKVNEFTNWSFKRDDAKGEAVGLIKRNGQWILAIQAGKYFEFYICDSEKAGEGNFVSIGRIECDKYKLKEFQNVNLYLNDKDDLFMFGMPYTYGTTDDKCALYKITLTKKNGTYTIEVALLSEKHFHRKEEGPRFCFAASIYCDNDILRIFSTEAHVENGSIRCCEWINWEGRYTSDPVDGGRYQVMNVKSRKVLDVSGKDLSNGAKIIQYHPTYRKQNQTFEFMKQSDNTWMLKALHSNKVLAVPGSSKKEHEAIIQYTNLGINDQKWRLESSDKGSFKLKNVNSDLVMDVTDRSDSDGAIIQQVKSKNEDCQRFMLIDAGGNMF